MVWVLYPLVAYLLGSIPFGRIIGKAVARVDVREKGSRNIGATNVAREVGIKWGALTLVLDALKGAAPVLVLHMGGFEGGLAELCGLAAILGHQFSVFLGFRGGKGVATALGIFFALEPFACGAALGVFLVVVLLTDIISLGSIAASCSVPLFIFLFSGPIERIGVAVAVSVLIVIAHRENIGRIIRGEERRWKRDVKDHPRRSRSPSSSSSE
ncbi:MAG: glycerol-3-phosphate 1-O-acyltransferase PlsY [Thermodesulfobacteriota bacterium]